MKQIKNGKRYTLVKKGNKTHLDYDIDAVLAIFF
jgi:hypothetical protein